MEENGFFRKALADFTQEAASGGAIRHLTDRGYTVKQIRESLDFPASYERVRKAVWERLLDTGVILRKEPGSGGPAEKFVYVREYDKYGKASFRRAPAEGGYDPVKEKSRKSENHENLVPVKDAEKGDVPDWKVRRISEEEGKNSEKLAALLHGKAEENGAEFSYMSCSFGLTAYRKPAEYEKQLAILGDRSREYLEGLPWEKQTVYHRLDSRMREILAKLYRAGYYQGACYFLKTRERIDFP